MATTRSDKDRGEKPAGKALLEETHDYYTLTVEVDAEQMYCHGSFESKLKGDWINPESLEQRLNECGIREGLLGDRIAAFCRSVSQGKSLEKVLLAQGRLPEPGPDGWIEFLVRVSSKEIQLNEEDDDGTVDMRALNFFANVQPGEQIARIHPPKNGEAGITVTGEVIPPRLGASLEVRPGEGVRFEEDGQHVSAEIPGRVVYEGGALSVTEDYTVNGDVNFEVGSINFIGRAEVRGDVLDDFDVIATKGVSVSGTVGACRIESDNDIVLGSMAGKGVGTVKCGGNLTARYLNEVHVECEGNVVVTSEIRNSTIKAGGCVRVENGPISGGECIALAGIEAKVLGSVLGVRTELTSGVYFREVDRLKYLNARNSSLSEQIKRISDTLGPLAKKKVSKSLEGAINKRIALLNSRLEELSEEKAAVVAELHSFCHQEHATANAKVNAQSALQEGVVICLGEVTEEIRSEQSGPLSIIENTVEPGLRFLSLSPLTVLASSLEAEELQEESAS